MLLLVVFAVAVALVPVFGGRLRALTDLRLHGIWLIFAALAVQLLLIVVPGRADAVRVAAHVSTYGMGVGFLFLNRRVSGLWIVAVGGLSNFLAIAANGGTLPASPHALSVAGLPLHPGSYANSAALAHPRLLFLGDVFAVPKWLPFANTFSVGDVLIVLGAAYAVHRVAGSRLASRAQGRTARRSRKSRTTAT